MEDYAFINVDKLFKLFPKLTHSEFNMVLLIVFYLSSCHQKEYVNSISTREYLASMGFDRTPERICSILSSLVKKGILRRETQGVFTVVDKLYVPVKVEEYFS